MDARPFLRATSSLHARTTRVRFESRKTLSRLSPHRRFSTRPDLDAKTFPRKAKKKTARAVFGFRVTHPERSQIRRRVLRSVLAEPAREHISRAMSETSASCSLVTHDASSSPFRCVERKREEEGGGGTSFLLFFQRRSGLLSVCFVCVCVFGLKDKKKDDTKIMSFFWWECDLKKRKKIILRQKILSTGFVDFGWGCHFFTTTTTRSIPKSVESVYFSLLFSPNMSFRFSLHKSLLLLLQKKKRETPSTDRPRAPQHRGAQRRRRRRRKRRSGLRETPRRARHPTRARDPSRRGRRRRRRLF